MFRFVKVPVALIFVVTILVIIATHTFPKYKEPPHVDFRNWSKEDEMGWDSSRKEEAPPGLSQAKSKVIVSLERQRDINKKYQHLQDVNRCSTVESTIRHGEKNSFPLVALASYPRSGNTWLRRILQISSQYYTSSMYWQEERKKENADSFKGAEYDFKEGRGICTKTHLEDERVVRSFPAGAILLIRNPRQVLISVFMHAKIKPSERREEELQKRIEEIKNNSATWRDSSRQSIRRWKSMYTSWLKHAKRILVVHHGDLCQNTAEELKRILNFLNLPVDMDKIQCTLDLYQCHLREYFHFQPEFPDEIDEYVNELNRTLLQKHLQTIPT